MKQESSTKLKVVVIGSYNADLTVRCDKPLVAGKSLIGGPMQIFGGGRGANCAVAAARAECAVTFIGARGRDGFGGMAQGQLAKESINLDYFIEVPNVKTGTSLSLVEAITGKHFLVCAESANDNLTAQHIEAAHAAILAADLVLSELEIPSSTVWTVMRLCEEHRIPFVLDISPLGRIDAMPKANTWLVVSESIEEAMRITNSDTPTNTINELHCLGCQNVVLIENSRKVIHSDGRSIGAATVPINQIVDRCGATECLETWVALMLMEGISLAEACERSVQAMAHSLSRQGGHQSMPRVGELTI
jgi:ribokinase